MIRTDKQDPMRQMTLKENMEIPGVITRRVGRPRQPWVVANCQWMYEQEHTGQEYSREDHAHNEWVKKFALERTF